MTAEKEAPQPTTRFEVWQLASILSGGAFVFLLWTTYRPPAALAGLLFLGVATAAYARNLPFVGIFVLAFVPMEVRFGWRSQANAFATAAALAVYIAVQYRFTAAATIWPAVARPKQTLWQILTTPIMRLLGLKTRTADPTPFQAGELLGFAAVLSGAALLTYAWWDFAPRARFSRFGLGIDRGWPIAAALAVTAGLAVAVVRSMLSLTDPDRDDPKLAELELNEIAWSELRPDLELVGEKLGAAAAKNPLISELYGPETTTAVRAAERRQR